MTPDMPYDDPHDDGGTNTDSIMPTDNQQDIIYTIALTRINYFSLNGMLELYRRLGSATAVMEHRNDIRDIVPEASPRLADALKDMSGPLRIAEAELRYDEEHGITQLRLGDRVGSEELTMNDTRYPSRLRECGDAPLMLFYKGNTDLNRTRVLSIVGTRHCTAYGQDLIRRFCDDLRQICPDVLIISGLAYGVDICAHRNALRTGFDTAAVLAHGLDTVYPSSHRETACEMTSHGGLITEFLTQTNADKVNFVRRNRIVAGMADATLLVESAERGGGLITTSIAQSYGREVFAFPGAVGMAYSEGCNRLIRDNGAALITCAADLAASMAWDSDQALLHARQQGIERQLFPELTGDERLIVATLAKTNDMQTNMLAARSGIPVQRMSALLFSLEMKGVVKMYAGGIYHLLQ